MRIGIDIDGTINNFTDVAVKYVEKDYGIKWNGVDYNIYPNMNLKEIHAFMDKYREEFVQEVQPLENAKEVIDELLNAKNQIFFITARDYLVADDTLRWLRMNGFSYTDVLFNCGNKVDACKFKQVDFMIDDSPHNLMALNKGNVPYIVFDQPYNQDIYGEEFRAKNWNDLYNFFGFFSM